MFQRLAQLVARRRQFAPLWLLFGAVLGGCGPSADDPRAGVEALVERAVAAAEAGDHRALLELVARDYEDDAGRDRRQVGFYLRTLLGRYPGVTMAVRSLDIELDSPRLARAELALVAIARREGAPLPVGLDADLIRLRLALRRDDDWLVTRADRLTGVAN
jgi:hypothetical protein